MASEEAHIYNRGGALGLDFGGRKRTGWSNLHRGLFRKPKRTLLHWAVATFATKREQQKTFLFLSEMRDVSGAEFDRFRSFQNKKKANKN